ncbi:MAG: formimidoylglutamate deiminase [Pararhodobacter sp.]|nr:formimidoylglutamate deiminase [Pararhodobacter sp.]
MQRILASQALLPHGWTRDVTVEIADDGRISTVTSGDAAAANGGGVLLPAPANLHSHAFQRAMAGLTEARGPDPRDTFWTWRELMFRFLDRLTPEDVQAIAALVQAEMLEAGYACNVEFHYLHHRPGGLPYASVAEMSERIAAAAAETGIGLTLLPALYEVGGCDGRALGPGQIRFGNSADTFARIVAEAERALSHLPPDAGLGVAPHSLRAVSPAGLASAIAIAGDRPIHMHLAEQQAEVDEVLANRGARPVEWLIGQAELGPQWCLVHCTRMTGQETAALGATGAIAGLCPITEASLGDGIFDAVGWRDAAGRFGVGSDSNIRISLTEELRSLEYSQRLRDRTRAVLAEPGRSTGRVLFDSATQGGAIAAGRDSGQIAPGRWADLVMLDGSTADLVGLRGDTILDTWIFAENRPLVRDVWAAGRHMVRDGRHVARDGINARYAATIRRLRDAI